MCWVLWKRTPSKTDDSTASTVVDVRSPEFSPNISTTFPENTDIHENSEVICPSDHAHRYRAPENNETIQREEIASNKRAQKQCFDIWYEQCCCCCYIHLCCNLC